MATIIGKEYGKTGIENNLFFYLTMLFLCCIFCVSKREIMNLLTKCDEPILNSLVRIYRHDGKWIETTRKYKKRMSK